jgi:hypothetical protein
MATLSELAATIAKAEGMDPATVALTARYVREAGFIEKRGRGTSAASMGVKDAANLLIAINAASSVGAAAAVVRDYRGLIAINDETSNVNGTFGQALEALIESAIERKLPSTFLSEKVPDDARDAFEREEIVISIRFDRPSPSVFLEIRPPAKEVSLYGMHTLNIPRGVRALFIPKHGQEKRTPRKMNIGDRRDQTTIGNVTIFAIAEKLR